ncbi:MAG: aminotransferase class V-fold PLP-dependent enzyme [Gemmatimonadetes bacterium]|nr:aminotransferase class V-fold PLP-dependent enzyme [Gemmatimonadota bacterium]MXX70779.1 aminotransferase class V-fold PLP-dependent enzyme [Gemmatimonadota bacterium]MYC92714.1 aminotransferase class V-fold PLP-dependent enzyme [Gemmatimonadota bacterium]MYG37105.1 aminotransferase class V-fold PLP-dependent enzyme [Gemmatimonadota bacterium]MYJ17910.1 aminotransferase class V-fold PLP-dependent enzyme [Gemmatimonadota bacterium]
MINTSGPPMPSSRAGPLAPTGVRQMKRQTSRRNFLAEMAAGAFVLPPALSLSGRLPGSGPPPLPSAPSAPRDESWWELVRAQFSFTDERVPMNAANLCPSPRSVAARVEELTRDIDRDCSFNNRAKFRTLTEASRAAVAGQLGVSADEIAIVRNTSESNNTINNGVPLRAGDEVVLWNQNHPTNNVAWDVRAARFGITVKRVSVPRHPASAQELIDPFVAALTDRTRVLSVTHVSNVSGIRLPVRELVEAARPRGIHVHLDGAQSWGALDVNLRELGCDSYSASAHKWFMGPKEAGLLYVRESRIPEIWPNIVAPGWGNDADPDVEGARKFESLGQRDDACLAAVGTTADFHDTIGGPATEARVSELATVLKQGLAELGMTLVTPMDPALSGGVCIIEVPGDRGTALRRLYEDHGIAGAGTGGLRLCPHVYNTREHIDRAVAGVKALRDVILG